MCAAPRTSMDASADRFMLAKLCREVTRAERIVVEHATREAKRLGDVPPVTALHEVANHATAMNPRFRTVVTGHGIRLGRNGIGPTASTLRHLVVDHGVDAERAYRNALLDLRHGLDIVELLLGISRHDGLFGVMRWTSDWLMSRRTLVARVEAHLAWYAARAIALCATDDWHADRTT
ncbi:MAG: hypothetical protein ABI867_12555 [Kofleriaceae bacterium]